MNDQLLDIRKNLAIAKGERGRLTKIATACGLSYRTIYGVMSKEDKTPSADTVDRLSAYFKKENRKKGTAS